MLNWLDNVSALLVSCNLSLINHPPQLLLIITGIVLVSIGLLTLCWRFLNKRRQFTSQQHRPEQIQTAWHSMTAGQVLIKLKASMHGLVKQDIVERQHQYGFNRLPEIKPPSVILRFLRQFHNLIIYVLLITAIITLILGHLVDSGVIFAVVIINALISFIQEGKAEQALVAIRKMLSPQASVVRDGKKQSIQAEQLVPGDIVQLQSGDKVPADLRLLKCKNLFIQEAVLTGESMPVEKQSQPVTTQAELGDRLSMAYSGTLVSSGQATAIVVATGSNTEIGLISALVSKVESLLTPLLKQVAQFGRWLTAAIVVLAIATFLFGLYVRDYAVTDMFMAAVGLAIAAIPEGLPAIMSITLAIGVQGMAKRHVIIRRLPAVETLGSVTVICTDKTGTLTCNEMAVTALLTAENVYSLSGVGYNPRGNVELGGEVIKVVEHPVVLEMAQAALLCNDASLHNKQGLWTLHGDPTEGALLTMALKAGLNTEQMQQLWPRVDHIPFESEHRFMATLHHDSAAYGFTYIKGAPEVILEMCSMQRTGDGDTVLNQHYWLEHMSSLAKQGLRLLAIAMKRHEKELQGLDFKDVESDLVLLGVVGMIDPPRAESLTAVQQCQRAGIVVKMITGDHADTASAIGEQLGLIDTEKVLVGHEIERLSDTELQKAVGQINIFARSSPEHKLRLVTAMQANNDIVAMTGDGVNDAPALKRADIGIAMGNKGTEAAKEAAEMVLTDDNFAALAQAVCEGRTVYDNLRKAILFILPSNSGEALIIIAAIIMGTTLPITAVQILWVNMITAVSLALTLAFEKAESDVMSRPPRHVNAALLSGFLIWRIAFVGLIMLSGTFGLFLWEQQHGESVQHMRTVAVNTLVMFEIFYLFNARKIEASIFNREGFTGNRYALLAVFLLFLFQLAFTYLRPMQLMFGTVSISLQHWLLIVAVAFLILPLVELEKAILRKFRVA